MSLVISAMTQTLIISGTDTGIGKSTVSAMLVAALGATYWKPIQSGTDGGTDTGRLRALTALPDAHFLPEKYVLSQPLSPHRAAELDAVEITPFPAPTTDRTLIIEGAGGLLVPITRSLLQIDIFKQWNAPVILCARTGLGTINHTLLSADALHHREIPLHGIIFIGEDNPDNMRTIADFADARVLGRMPHMDTLNRENLLAIFAQNFRKADFE